MPLLKEVERVEWTLELKHLRSVDKAAGFAQYHLKAGICLKVMGTLGYVLMLFFLPEHVEEFMFWLVTAAAKRALCQRANGSLARCAGSLFFRTNGGKRPNSGFALRQSPLLVPHLFKKTSPAP
jgi:hypothetical protein